MGREEIALALILLWNSAQKLMDKQHLPKSALKTLQDVHRKTYLKQEFIYNIITRIYTASVSLATFQIRGLLSQGKLVQ